jgi:hypothetical protein
MMTYSPKRLLLALTVTGCFAGGSASAAEEPRAGTVVPEGEMTMFCQHAAEARYRADPDDVSADPPVRREGKLVVLGTVDGDTRDYGFDCRFEENGAYIGLAGDPAMND